MKALVLLTALAPLPAHADLFRWVDPQSGSVKFANSPPPWFGDPEREHRYPAVEVIRYQPVPTTSAKPAAAESGPSVLAALEARFASLLQFFQSLPRTPDFERAGAGFQQQAEMYQAVSAELDRIDPSGAQFSAKPPLK